jgi:RNA polymerase sigma-70 factor, ECF subfamily
MPATVGWAEGVIAMKSIGNFGKPWLRAKARFEWLGALPKNNSALSWNAGLGARLHCEQSTLERAPISFPVRPAPVREQNPRAERIEPRISDGEIVRRLAEGDSWAKDALYRRYVDLVWGTALRLVGSRVDAEDIVQDTFVAAFDDLRSLRRFEALRPWLVQITVHQAHRRFRRRAMLRRLGLDRSVEDAPLSSLVHSGVSPEVTSELVRIDRALADVAGSERVAWILRHVDGYTLYEVASACRCSLATAKRRVARANARIERHLHAGAEP